MRFSSVACRDRVARRPVRVEPLEARRLLSAAALDPTFGDGGKVTSDFPAPASDSGYDLLVQPDGKYVVAGVTGASVGYTEDAGFAFARYNPDGSLDPSFGQGGKVVVPFGRYGAAAAAALAPGGKIVAAGMTSESRGPLGRGQDFAIVRLNPDGTLDNTFDGDGRQTIDFDGREDAASDVVVLGDGRIVVLGRADDARPGGRLHDVLARLRPDGSLDPTFGGDGRLDLTVPNASFAAGAITLDSAGRLLVAGGASVMTAGTPSGGFAVVRLLDDGALDTSFASAGLAVSASGGTAQSVVIDPAGRILLTGAWATGTEAGTEAAVSRLLPDGSVDTTFGGGDGFATVGLGPRNDYGRAAAVDAAGNIVVTGNSDDPRYSGGGFFAVFRLDPAGTPDASFGTGGAWMSPTAWSEGRAVAAVPGGGVVVAGHTRPAPGDGGYQFALLGFDAAGRLDPAFGAGGEVTTNFLGYASNDASAMVVQPDGKVIVGGTTDLNDDDWSAFTLARYTPGGTLDPTFGTGGRAAAVPGLRGSTLSALALQADGRIVAAGSAWDARAQGGKGMTTFAVVRYLPDGTPDASFGQGGKVSFAFDDVNDFVERARAVAIQADGKIVVAGDNENEFIVARLTPSGALDASFGNGGKAPAGVGATGPWGGFAYPTSIGLGPGGAITLAGPVGTDFLPSGEFAVARFDSAGRLDASFGPGGRTVVGVSGSYDDVKLLVTADGGVVLGTTTMTYGGPGVGWSDRDFALLRLRPDGSLDTFFGGVPPGPDGTEGGLVSVDFAGGDDVLHALVLLPDGSVIAAGSTTTARSGGDIFDGPDPFAPSDFALACLSPGGMFDVSSFPVAKTTTDFGGYDDVARALALTPAGQLVAAGTAVVPGDATDFAVARYTLDPAPPPDHWLRGAYVFYNNSAFDGPADGEADDLAVAPDKVPLRPGEPQTPANVTNYAAGINGVILDVIDRDGVRVESSGRAADPAAPGGWRDVPPDDAQSRVGAGADGSVRHTLTWSDGTIRNTWLQLTVDVYAGDALVEHDVFAFGNLIGDANGDGKVSALDLGQAKRFLNSTAGIDSPADFNRDGRVTALDLGIAKRYLNNVLPTAALPAPPPPTTPAAAELAPAEGAAASLLARDEPPASPLPP
jgi:uncharacterized delta-60 repeat protein